MKPLYIKWEDLQKGCKVKCINDNTAELDKGELTEGKEYTIISVEIVNSPQQYIGIYILIRIINDKGFEETYGTYRFIAI